jgi:amino acid transporter
VSNKISLSSLILLIVAAIASTRNLPTTAFFGSSLILLFFLSSLFFLIPVSLISAEFSSRYPTQGGVFYWVGHAFGKRIGLLAVWLQWVNTIVWYPTMLLFISGTIAYLIDPAFVENKTFLITTNLIVFWGLTLLNLQGVKVSLRFNSLCGALGTLLPMGFLIFLGGWWIASDRLLAISFSWDSLVPPNLYDSSVALVTIMTSFLGMELAGVYVNDIENPQKNFPRAIGYSVFILLSVLIFGALSIGIVIPKDEIHFVGGVMQTFTTFLDEFQLSFLVPFLAISIIVGSIGGSINWLLSPAQGLFQAAEHGFLPDFFLVKNQHGMPIRILVVQAVIVSLLCCAMQFLPSINACYWFLMALSTGLYMAMYMLLFLSALKLKRPEVQSHSYQIPKGMRTVSCVMGMMGCAATIIIGLQPYEEGMIDNSIAYACMSAAGFIVMIIPVLYLWGYQKKILTSNVNV